MNVSLTTRPPDTPDDDSTRFSELLPWLANGRLGRDDAQWMGSWMVTRPEAQQEFISLLATQANLANQRFDFDPEVSLVRALRRLRDSSAVSTAAAANKGWAQWFKQQFSRFQFHPLRYAAVLVIAVQSGALLNQKLLLDEKYGVARTTPVANKVDEVVLMRITFDPDIREEELRLAIASVNGKIVGGPGRLGDYYVKVEGTAENAKKRLKTYPKVVSTLVVASVPEKD
jgi:hypothetical protein